MPDLLWRGLIGRMLAVIGSLPTQKVNKTQGKSHSPIFESPEPVLTIMAPVS
ncbi:MAG: hypothetical protein WCA35_02365 [Kovacikia sp.]